jgi:signal transduction histidine kinase
LAIVREVVLSHEGDVEISETHGGGAAVRISLPLADSSIQSNPEELLR